MKLINLICLPFILPVVYSLPSPAKDSEKPKPVNETTCNGRKYSYDSLVGYGFLPSNFRDKFGDTLGGTSSIAFEPSSWKKTSKGTYEGVIWALPDRGWNTQGTINYQNRIHKITLSLKLQPEATANNSSLPNLKFTYLDTILLYGPDGKPTTGLRPDKQGPYLSYPGFPEVPSATFKGDGFGGPGSGGSFITLDSEGLAIAKDGSFYVSDEYGPYIYHFSSKGQMLQAIQPPNAYLPRRNGSISFASADPPVYDPNDAVIPSDVQSGRTNNQGLEGLTISENGQKLYALMQSALSQEGGTGNPTRKQARLLEYEINGKKADYQAEYVVTLPLYDDGKKVAAQSEIYSLPKDQFFVMARDSGAGHGQSKSESLYRHADVFDISRATNIKRPANDDSPTAAIADKNGVLKPDITPAQYCTFLDFNVNSELAKFGLHNGGAQDQFLLNEKWESLGLVPIEPEGGGGGGGEEEEEGKDDMEKGEDKEKKAGEYFLFSFSDNDFVTQNGAINFGQTPYKDKSGYNLDSQALVFRVTLPS